MTYFARVFNIKFYNDDCYDSSFLYLQKEGDVNGGIPKSGQRNDCVIPVADNVHFSAQNENSDYTFSLLNVWR